MIIHKINPSVDYKLWLKLLDTQLNEPINENPINPICALVNLCDFDNLLM